MRTQSESRRDPTATCGSSSRPPIRSGESQPPARSRSSPCSGAHPVASASCTPFQMTVAADGSVWFIENIPGNVAKVETGPGAATASAAPGKGSATVTWTAPLNGGTPITGFTIDTYKGTTLVATTNAAANALSASISGLADGTVYSFKV